MSTRIVVFSGGLSHSVRKGIVSMDERIPGLDWLVIVHSPPRAIRRLLRSQWSNLRRNGWRWLPYQTAELLGRLLARADRAVPASRPGGAFTDEALAVHPRIRIVRSEDIHAQRTLELVRDFAPDLGISLAAPILKEALFGIPRLGTINLHKGRLPDFRGMPPAFWELWHDEQSVGCSVHRVDRNLDTGDLLGTSTVVRSRYSTLRGLQLELDEVGVELMCEVVQDLLEGRRQSVPQSGIGRTFRKPTLQQMATLQRRMDDLQPVAHARPWRWLKDAAALCLWLAWHAGLRLMLTPRVTVLLYHRVTDDARDNLSIGIEQFDRQMGLLSRHCTVVSLSELLAWERVPSDARPVVAVTFDDGYKDNFTHAAPILGRHGLPAAFFVSSGLIGSNDRFPHDVRRGNSGIPNMTWDDLRVMRRSGFEIGSHSVSHVDCVAAPEQQVRTELMESRATLQRELGPGDFAFAYPYGGRRHMTAERLELVKSQGYSACLSAYGGSNVGRVDRFNVLRRGVNWEFSDRAFLAQCLGL